MQEIFNKLESFLEKEAFAVSIENIRWPIYANITGVQTIWNNKNLLTGSRFLPQLINWR